MMNHYHRQLHILQDCLKYDCTVIDVIAMINDDLQQEKIKLAKADLEQAEKELADMIEATKDISTKEDFVKKMMSSYPPGSPFWENLNLELQKISTVLKDIQYARLQVTNEKRKLNKLEAGAEEIRREARNAMKTIFAYGYYIDIWEGHEKYLPEGLNAVEARD
jgi:hypothetical protein